MLGSGRSRTRRGRGASMAMPAPDHPLLVSVPLIDPVVTRQVGLIRRSGRSLSPAAQQLYDLFGVRVKSRRAEASRRRTESDLMRLHDQSIRNSTIHGMQRVSLRAGLPSGGNGPQPPTRRTGDLPMNPKLLALCAACAALHRMGARASSPSRASSTWRCDMSQRRGRVAEVGRQRLQRHEPPHLHRPRGSRRRLERRLPPGARPARRHRHARPRPTSSGTAAPR